MSHLFSILKFLQQNLNINQKKIIISFFDSFLLLIAICLSLIIKYESINIYFDDNVYVFVIGVILFLLVSNIFKTNHQIIRSFNLSNVIFFLKVIFIFTIVFFSITFFFNFPNSPRSIPLFIGPIFFFIYIFSRFLLVRGIRGINANNQKIPILIYGAGSSGVYFQQMLNLNNKVIGFIDDDVSKIGRSVNNHKVFSFNDINNLIKSKNVKEIVVAIPRLNVSERKNFLKKLEEFQIKINFITLSYNDENSNKVLDFDNIRLYDLIDRNLKVDFDLNKEFFGKTIIISGAGGSIGSELSRQILMSEPKSLFLIDFSELNLFNLNKQLGLMINQFNIKTKINFKLLNLTDYKSLESLIVKIKDNHNVIDYVFHCAAYKHVSLVEENIIYSFKNNMLSTINLAKLADIFSVKKFVLISSDKAVRPKSMMGMTKYLSECYVKKISHNSEKTIFSIVRFGNVLGSSGSVLPIFNNQIKNGGPITITDKNATRFFMTIEEASYLVIQAAIIAKKSDILLINMGKPVKVIDLARRLLFSLGLNEKTTVNPNGIEIIITGLKKGEKLHEELLVNDKSLKTINDNLMIANEEDKLKLTCNEFEDLIKEIIKNNSETYLTQKLKELDI